MGVETIIKTITFFIFNLHVDIFHYIYPSGWYKNFDVIRVIRKHWLNIGKLIAHKIFGFIFTNHRFIDRYKYFIICDSECSFTSKRRQDILYLLFLIYHLFARTNGFLLINIIDIIKYDLHMHMEVFVSV